MTPDEIKDLLQIVAMLAIAYNVGSKLSSMDVSVKHLTAAVERLVGYPEKIARMETTIDDHERRITSGGL